MKFTSVDPNDPLPLVYPKIIDWDQASIHDIPTFKNDDAIVNFICFVNPDIGFDHELNNKTSTQGSVKFSSCKMNKKKKDLMVKTISW